MPTCIIIFEDDNALRHSLKTLLGGVEGYQVVGDYESCEKADKITKELKPDVVIMDIDLPNVNGIAGLRMIKEVKPDTSIIMHTVFEDDQRLFDSLCAGASGYMLKSTSFIQLLQSIEDVLNGGAPMSPSIARKVLRSFRQSGSSGKVQYDLSPREKEVLKYLVKGYSYKMIAASLFVTLATVQAHVKNIYTKLHVNCGREAVAIALRDKIV